MKHRRTDLPLGVALFLLAVAACVIFLACQSFGKLLK